MSEATLTPGELVGRSDREQQIRAAIEQVFVNGDCPSSIIVIADLNGMGKVRVSCVGALVELQSLLTVGVPQCIAMFDGARGVTPTALSG